MGVDTQKSHVCMHVEKYLKTYYNVEIITHDDLRHYFYLNGTNTFCFIERNVRKSDIQQLEKGLEAISKFPHSIRMSKSKHNNTIIKHIIHKYATEHFI